VPTETLTPPDLPGKLAEAQAAAEKLRRELNTHESELAKALEREDYPDADRAKILAAGVRPHLALAEAQVRALQDAMAALDAQRQAEQAAAQRQAMEAQARANLEHAMEADREASEQVQRHWAEAMAGLAAVKESLMRAQAADQAQTGARQSAHQALVDLGEREPSRYISGPNFATARIERSHLLTELLRSSLQF
jgi:hypothetical protein